MLFGAHVSAAGGLLPAIGRADSIGAEVIQLHTQSPRVWRPNNYSDELLKTFADQIAAHQKLATVVCHASYLINLGTNDKALLEKSHRCLVNNLEVATAMGAFGLVLHLGSHLGSGFEGVLSSISDQLLGSLDDAEKVLGMSTCRLLLENTAGAGSTIGRSFDELAAVLAASRDDVRLGVCLDTQHLFASGVSYESLEEADAVVAHFDKTIGLGRLGCLHVNDSKVPFGSNRDRHENLGEGQIGKKALGSLIGHPMLQQLPAVLEVPGKERRGPAAADIVALRKLHAAGRRRWAGKRRRELAADPSC